MSRWFRLHDEILDDPKVQRLSGDDFKAWVKSCCAWHRVRAANCLAWRTSLCPSLNARRRFKRSSDGCFTGGLSYPAAVAPTVCTTPPTSGKKDNTNQILRHNE